MYTGTLTDINLYLSYRHNSWPDDTTKALKNIEKIQHIDGAKSFTVFDVSSGVTVFFFFRRFNLEKLIRTLRLADMIRSADSIKMRSVVFFLFFFFLTFAILGRLTSKTVVFNTVIYQFNCHCYNNSVDLTLSLVYGNLAIRLKCKTVVCTNAACGLIQDLIFFGFLIFSCDFIIAWLPANALLLYKMYFMYTAVLSTHPAGYRCKDKTISQSDWKLFEK